jgi:hypothetical protein
MADSRPDQQEIPAKPRNLRFNRVIPKSGTPSGESPNRQSTNAAERAIRTFLAPGMGMQPNPRHELRRALDRQSDTIDEGIQQNCRILDSTLLS